MKETTAVPIYEYQCKSCGEKFEKLVRTMGEAKPKIACPKCGSEQTTKALSVFAVAESSSVKGSDSGPMCGRCGGPGPCALD
jgi:putative FmdB family regulatory protein